MTWHNTKEIGWHTIKEIEWHSIQIQIRSNAIFKNIVFKPVYLRHIVELRWENWDLSAEHPLHYPEDGSEIEKVLALTEDRFNKGEVTRTDIAGDQGAVAMAKFSCGIILRDEYCKTAITAADTERAGVKEEMQVGMRTADDYLRALQKYFALRISCE
jgi:hypothetical protein